MLAPRTITEASDPRLADYARLTDVALRRRLEPAGGLFIAEGEKVFRRALAAGYPVRSLLLAPERLAALGDVVTNTLATAAAPVYLADAAVLQGVTGFHVHRGVLAAMQRLPLPDVTEVLAAARRVLVLEDVNDHTNVGAIFRNAAALGMDAVLLSPRCADPLYRRSVRVSMGAVFSTPYCRLASWADAIGTLRAAGFATLALTPAAGAEDIDTLPARLRERCAVLLGGEGRGLSPRWLADADARVRIPMARGVDSLNVAAASAVACYALTRPWRDNADSPAVPR